MEELLIRMLSGGHASAVAVIIVVLLFLRHLSKSGKILKEITDLCHDHQKKSQAAFQEQVHTIGQRYDRQAIEMNDRYDRINQQTMTAINKMTEVLIENGQTLKSMKGSALGEHD